ncbi:unnamed protein product, partial [Nesidiocoris tenuis]
MRYRTCDNNSITEILVTDFQKRMGIDFLIQWFKCGGDIKNLSKKRHKPLPNMARHPHRKGYRSLHKRNHLVDAVGRKLGCHKSAGRCSKTRLKPPRRPLRPNWKAPRLPHFRDPLPLRNARKTRNIHVFCKAFRPSLYIDDALLGKMLMIFASERSVCRRNSSADARVIKMIENSTKIILTCFRSLDKREDQRPSCPRGRESPAGRPINCATSFLRAPEKKRRASRRGG